MKSHKLKFAFLLLLVLGTIGAAKWVGYATIKLWMETFILQVQGLGWSGILLYLIVFALACILAVPAMPLTVGAGIIFPFWAGLAIALGGLALGGASSFLVARHLARDLVVEKLKDSPKFRAIDTAIGHEGWKIVILLRMCPIPFGLASYIYGITSIRFWHHLIATLLGVIPGTAFFVYLGHAGKAGIDSASSKNPAMLIPLGIGLVAGVACLLFVGKIARRAVAKATRESPIPSPELVEMDPS